MKKAEYIKKYGIDAYNDYPKVGKPASKYTECKNQVLKWAWESLEKPLKSDFNIDLSYEMRLIPKYNKNFGMIILYKDNIELAAMTAPYGRYDNSHSLKIGREIYEQKEDRVHKSYKYFVSFDIPGSTKEVVNNVINDRYLSDIFTGIIELMNQIVLEAGLKDKYDKEMDQFITELTK